MIGEYIGEYGNTYYTYGIVHCVYHTLIPFGRVSPTRCMTLAFEYVNVQIYGESSRRLHYTDLYSHTLKYKNKKICTNDWWK